MRGLLAPIARRALHAAPRSRASASQATRSPAPPLSPLPILCPLPSLRPLTRRLLHALPSSHVTVSPEPESPLAISSFAELTLHPRLRANLSRLRLELPTPIQAHTARLLLRGEDLIASAHTGSGKSLMFSLPLMQRLLDGNTSLALLLSPTRELATQTFGLLSELSRGTGVRCALLTGGESLREQRGVLAKGAEVVIGTPGRVLALAADRSLRLRGAGALVVDEGDTMLAMGFEPQLRRIVRELGPPGARERQGVLCSATFPPELQRLASSLLKPDYRFAAAGKVGATHSGITQRLQWVDGGSDCRRAATVEAVARFQSGRLPRDEGRRVLVFCNSREETEQLAKALRQRVGRELVETIHGDKAQHERDAALRAFRNGRVTTLVGTDVASRGLDVAGIGLVVQSDAPREIEAWVHRVGRTARGGGSGEALTLLCARNIGIAPEMVKLLAEASQLVPSWLQGMAHVVRARELEQQSLVEAGGGQMGGGATPSRAESGGSLFSEQDFRSSATPGSWGSTRDTSYAAFDVEAYGEKSQVNDNIDEGDGFGKEMGSGNEKDESFQAEVVDPIQGLQESKPSAELYIETEASEELLQALQRLRVPLPTPTETPPSRRVLRQLESLAGRNSLPSLDYIGLWPFEKLLEAGLLTRPRDAAEGGGSSLPRVLMVAEKPSIAKVVAETLAPAGRVKQVRGISRALPVYQFTSDSFAPAGGARCTFVVTSVVGHIFSLSFSKSAGSTEGAAQRHLAPSEYFSLPVVKRAEESSEKLRVVDHLRACAAGADHLVLWLDCDAEGENIAHEVIGVTRRALDMQREKGASPSEESRVHRAKFSSLTPQALRASFESLGKPDPHLSRSVDARQELDLRVGVAFTRLLSWRLMGAARKRFSPATRLISYGPCQTPALYLSAARAHEIESFQAERFWRVSLHAISGAGTPAVQLQWLGGELAEKSERAGRVTKSKERAELVISRASSHGARLVVRAARTRTDRLKAPSALNTVGLLVACSKAMAMSPKAVMSTAEKLYAGGFISYPRTESTKYDETFDVRGVLRQHSRHPVWGGVASRLLHERYSSSAPIASRGVDRGDHPPITPTRVATRDDVGGGMAWRVYELVCRSFFGSLGDDVRLDHTSYQLVLEADSRGGEELFTHEVTAVRAEGFGAACPWVLRDACTGGAAVDWRTGDRLVVDGKPFCESGMTRPPRFLQEHELIQGMDAHRIGTDASMATHVANIVERGYVVVCDEQGFPLRPPQRPGSKGRKLERQIGRYMVPTPLGLALVRLLCDDEAAASMTRTSETLLGSEFESEDTTLLALPEIRARIEDEVAQVASQSLNKDAVLERNLKWFTSCYNQLERKLSTPQGTKIFSQGLCPTDEQLSQWRKRGFFESNAMASANTRREKRNHPPAGNTNRRNSIRRVQSKSSLSGEKPSSRTGSRRTQRRLEGGG